MDDDFRILFDYVEQMKRELQDEADLQTKSDEDEEKKCVHESIETEEAYVCCKMRTDLCFAICRFSQVRFITPSHLTHNLFFYFQ